MDTKMQAVVFAGIPINKAADYQGKSPDVGNYCPHLFLRFVQAVKDICAVHYGSLVCVSGCFKIQYSKWATQQ
jgi:hypothetical protein